MLILIGIIDIQNISLDGIKKILSENKDFEVVFAITNQDEIINILKKTPVNIIIINVHNAESFLSNHAELLKEITRIFPRISVLILSTSNSENVIFKFLKFGAKGFLSKDSTCEELYEAIYTIRNGHDYFNKSISNVIVKNYFNKINENQKDKNDLTVLTSREIEILKLWGKGFSNQDIADKLFISVRTVETHKNHIMQKLNLKNTVDSVKFAIRNNIIEI